MTLSDRVAIFDRGVVQQIGAPLELYDHPVNVFVAGFLGSPPMNFLDGEVIDGPDGPGVAGEGFVFPIGARRHGVARGQRVVVGLRPEDVAVGPPADGNAVTTISLVEPMGSTTIVYAPLGGKLIAVEVAKGSPLVAGTTVAVGVAAERLHLFDPATERALPAA
jgi:multiple sugar transport system ATP-binding protein